MKVRSWLGIAVAAAAVGAGGPIGSFAGGPSEAGERLDMLRLDDKIYERQLVEVEDTALIQVVGKRITEKYAAPEGSPDSIWLFRLDDRAQRA